MLICSNCGSRLTFSPFSPLVPAWPWNIYTKSGYRNQWRAVLSETAFNDTNPLHISAIWINWTEVLSSWIYWGHGTHSHSDKVNSMSLKVTSPQTKTDICALNEFTSRCCHHCKPTRCISAHDTHSRRKTCQACEHPSQSHRYPETNISWLRSYVSMW